MEHVISEFRLMLIVKLAAELGATGTLIEIGKRKPYLNKSEAIRLYGKKTLASWVESGLVIPIKDGSHSAPFRFDRMELETISKCNQFLKILLIGRH